MNDTSRPKEPWVVSLMIVDGHFKPFCGVALNMYGLTYTQPQTVSGTKKKKKLYAKQGETMTYNKQMRWDNKKPSLNYINSYSASHDNWCTVWGNGGCRVGEVRAGTTSPMPDHKGFKLQ